MYWRHRGIIPPIATLTGLLIAVYGIVAIAFNAYWSVFESDITSIRGRLILLLTISIISIGLSPLIFLGLAIAGLFPDIQVAENGLNCRYYFFLRRTIPWEAIQAVISFSRLKGWAGVALRYKGFAVIWKGYFFNRLYGIAFGQRYPLLLLHLGPDRQDETIAMISQKAGKTKHEN